MVGPDESSDQGLVIRTDPNTKKECKDVSDGEITLNGENYKG